MNLPALKIPRTRLRGGGEASSWVLDLTANKDEIQD
jgi:hypothetical protein